MNWDDDTILPIYSILLHPFDPKVKMRYLSRNTTNMISRSMLRAAKKLTNYIQIRLVGTETKVEFTRVSSLFMEKPTHQNYEFGWRMKKRDMADAHGFRNELEGLEGDLL